jgi:uncharacterized DUF497 family protein
MCLLTRHEQVDVLTKCIYNAVMRFEWDKAKNEANIQKRGLDFADAVEMFDGPMLTKPDARTDYGETRYIGFGHIQGRLMAIVFTERLPDVTRIISLRKANQREKTVFEKEIKNRLGAS